MSLRVEGDGTGPARPGLVDRPPPPGQQAVALAALVLGLVLLALQLWLLTIALDLYLAGEAKDAWVLAIISGAVFAGGLMALHVLSRAHAPWSPAARAGR